MKALLVFVTCALMIAAFCLVTWHLGLLWLFLFHEAIGAIGFAYCLHLNDRYLVFSVDISLARPWTTYHSRYLTTFLVLGGFVPIICVLANYEPRYQARNNKPRYQARKE